MYYLQSRYYNPALGRFINADKYPSTGQGLTGNNMFAYCGNNPVSRKDACGDKYKETQDNYRVVGAGVQVELDMGNITVGFEVIVYWDVEECGDNPAIIAIYTYSGGSINFCDELLGSITAAIRDNLDLVTSGTEDGLEAMVNILETNYSASVSGLLITGNERFTSVKSYTGPFLSLNGSVGNIKGGVAVSDTCVAVSLGTTSSSTPSWGLSLTNYTLQGIIPLS